MRKPTNAGSRSGKDFRRKALDGLTPDVFKKTRLHGKQRKKEMEKLNKQEPAQQSQQELTSFCAERLQWALRMYPEQLRPSLGTQAEYTAEWLEIADQIGPDDFSAGLINAVRGSEYFPTIKKLRDCCGISEEKQSKARAEAAWLYVREHVQKFSSLYSTDAPKLPPRIAYATRLVGGLYQIEYCGDSSLPFMKKEFMAAWENYSQSAAAYDALLLESPLIPNMDKLLTMPSQPKMLSEGAAKMKEANRIAKEMPREMTDAEVEDRREMLRQQAEMLKKQFS